MRRVFSDSPVPDGGLLASVFLLAGDKGEDGGHQGVVDTGGAHSVARGAAWRTDGKDRSHSLTAFKNIFKVFENA